jgi:hypothetical protein
MMIACRISRRGIFKVVMCFVLVAGFCSAGFAGGSSRDIKARKKLVEKYAEDKFIKDRLETILIFGLGDLSSKTPEERNRFFDAPYDIASQKNPRATEALVDLLDFDLGELLENIIRERISLRGKEPIPFLKRKIAQKPLSVERNIRGRNEEIVEMIKALSCGARYIFDEKYSKEEIAKSYLFYVQMFLEKYYCKQRYYPKSLLEAFPVVKLYEQGELLQQKFFYKSYGQIYFLCALGKDGKFGTADDVTPPYNTDVFSFPDNFKE